MKRNENHTKSIVRELAQTSGWTESQAQTVVNLMLSAATRQADEAMEKQERRRRSARISATRKLLKNYRYLKESIESELENTVVLMKDTEFQRLMEDEISAKNQQVLSVAIQTASNKVLWERLNAALECLKEICDKSDSPGTRRGYNLIYDRYIRDNEMGMKALLSKYNIEQTSYYKNLNEAENILSLILFGTDYAEDFYAGEEIESA